MTVTTTNNRITHNGDGSTTAFPFPYLFLASTDIQVYVGTVKQTTGFTVTGAGDASGGTVTFTTAPAAAASIVLYRDPDTLQSTALPANGPFPAKSVETAVDKAMLGLQRVRELLSRALTLSDSDTSGASTILPSPVASQVIGWNASGTGLINFGPVDNTLLTAALAGNDGVLLVGNAADKRDLAATSGAALVGYLRGATASTAKEALDTLYYGVANVRSVQYAGGAKGDGTTGDMAAFQAAIDDAKATGKAVFIPCPDSFYNIEGALDCSVAGSPNQRGLTFIGVGGTSQDLPAIKFKHTGHGFDCTGGANYTFRDLNIGTDATTYPKTAFLFARNSSNGSAGRHRMINCHIVGKFSVANVYSYASEENQFDSCVMVNALAGAATKVMCFTGYNISSITSTFQTIATGAQSNLTGYVNGGSYHNQAGHASSDVFYLEAADGFRIHPLWALCASTTVNGRSIVYVDTTNAASNYGSVRNFIGETGTFLQEYGICFDGAVATPTGWTIDNSRLPSNTNAIYAGANVTLDNFHIKNIGDPSSKGLSAAGTIQNSVIDSKDLLLTIGTSTHNTLIGNQSRWTITTRTGGQFLDSQQGNIPVYSIVTGSRVAGTTYTNSTGKTMTVYASISSTSNAAFIGTVDGLDIARADQVAGSVAHVTFQVAPGSTYKVSASAGTATTAIWAEAV